LQSTRCGRRRRSLSSARSAHRMEIIWNLAGRTILTFAALAGREVAGNGTPAPAAARILPAKACCGLSPQAKVRSCYDAERSSAAVGMARERAVEAIATASGRVEMWRGGGRRSISVSAPFVWRCLTSRTVTPFPHPAHRTGHADLPHPALGQDFTPSPTARCAPARSDVRDRSTRRGARVDSSRPCVA
jgi:hypothetical protein